MIKSFLIAVGVTALAMLYLGAGIYLLQGPLGRHEAKIACETTTETLIKQGHSDRVVPLEACIDATAQPSIAGAMLLTGFLGLLIGGGLGIGTWFIQDMRGK